MKSERTIAIFFENFTKAAQKGIIAQELGRVTGDEDLYGYDPDPERQTLEQNLHVKARHNGHDHKWLMVWNCMEAEFTTVMEENQKL